MLIVLLGDRTVCQLRNIKPAGSHQAGPPQQRLQNFLASLGWTVFDMYDS